MVRKKPNIIAPNPWNEMVDHTANEAGTVSMRKGTEEKSKQSCVHINEQKSYTGFKIRARLPQSAKQGRTSRRIPTALLA